jgi:hypothetical protein
MMTVGRLNSLLVLEQLLGEPKSLGDLHEALFANRRHKDVPLLLPDGLEQFLRDEVRYGTVCCVKNGTGVKYQINPQVAPRVRAELDAAFSPGLGSTQAEAAA